MKTPIILIVLVLCGFAPAQHKAKIILDADTANEVDDLYAIVRAFSKPSWEIEALNSTQWQSSQWAPANSMEASHRLNLALMAYLRPANGTKVLRGGFRRMYDWGDKAQYSAATHNIIAQANQLKPGGKLTIVALGALTNVASALHIDPGIAPKIKLYWLGTSYDFDKNISKRIDFNAVMDPQATDLLLSSQVEMHIMPVSEVGNMKSSFLETKKRLEGTGPLGDFLIKRWSDHIDGGRTERVLWDTALIEAMLHPEWVEEVKVPVFENKNVHLYRHIDQEKFLDDCFTQIVAKLKKL